MKILHVFSANILAGSVFYALSLAEKHSAEGHDVFLVSDAENLPTSVPFFALPIANRSYVQRFKNISFLKNFIKQHGIQVLHSHSRAASWVSYFALRGTKIPLISTIHGRQHIHTSVQLFDIYGDRVIAICENLKKHLVDEVKMKVEKIALLGNSFDFEKIDNTLKDIHEVGKQLSTENNINKGKVISVIGRLNGGKGEIVSHLLEKVFPVLLEKDKNLIINLIGGSLEEIPSEGQAYFHLANEQYGNRIKLIGFVNNVLQWIHDADLVIGAGRVAIEALYVGTSVLALGEATCYGVVSEENIALCLASNFGDILPTKDAHSHDYNLISSQLAEFLQETKENQTVVSKQNNISNHIKQRFDINHIAEELLEIYKSEMMKKVHSSFIPILMYHKIPTEPIESANKIFVTKKNFEKHLKFFKFRGLTPITFKDYIDFREGKKSLKNFPKKPIILTFDDGYTDNYFNLLPLMEKYGYKGVIYLLGDFDVSYNFWDADQGDHRDEIMSREQKKTFVEKGWEIGSHTLTHRHLSQLSESEAFEEITEAKSTLEQVLGTEIISFAYPYGDLNETVKAQIKKSGHILGVATDSGGMTIEEDFLQVFRINIFPEESLFQLYKKTSPWYRSYYKKKRGK
ncbi:MAG: hypothetical protein EAZ08_11275 [Cytophagales bacterium]|nr:MAG: hypothetical protein EAZ08_11275 [Cytophagales bacterium]